MKYTMEIQVSPIMQITLKLFFIPDPGSNQASYI